MQELLNFQTEKLLIQALTHRSYVNEHPGELHNERLEFLGDAILNFLSGDYLYRRFPEVGEDEMTRRRSKLVDEFQLARFATVIGLADKMRLGQGAIKDGGYQNPNLLSSAFEAVIGAYYLDRNCNLEALRPLVSQLFELVPLGTGEGRSSVDPKNRFQEWVQAHISSTPPRYTTDRIGGPDHAPTYRAIVWVGEQSWGEGQGCGKKEAEKRAAENALTRIQESDRS
ncbi:MAG: ribonuclease III [Leptolyngbyaceae cyanobacterium bins.59]|nr:ribonuclease III [Leptolyngbyaceae cyanobacterium bins.59]